jgi:hypothetical protein
MRLTFKKTGKGGIFILLTINCHNMLQQQSNIKEVDGIFWRHLSCSFIFENSLGAVVIEEGRTDAQREKSPMSRVLLALCVLLSHHSSWTSLSVGWQSPHFQQQQELPSLWSLILVGWYY